MKILFVPLLFFSITACAHTPDNFDRVELDLKVYDQHISKRRSEFLKDPENINDKEWVKKKLYFMVEIDQYMRSYLGTPHKTKYTEEETKKFELEFSPRFEAIDKANTGYMKVLLEKYDWITISEFGEQADRNAWLLVQHADLDHGFQAETLMKLGRLWKSGETNPMNYAYLFDRVASSFNDESKRVPQRYGTQGKCIGPGKWEAHEMEAPANIDKRRKEVGLEPLQDYINRFKDICK